MALKKALVTGGAGFIGSHLCEALLARNFKVIAVDDFSTSSKSNILHLLKNKNFKFYRGSILNEKLVSKLISNSDIVYHLAAAVGVKFILDHPINPILTNIEGTRIVLKLADKYRKKVLFASTSEIYGKHVCSPISEDDDRILGSTRVNRWSYSGAKAVDEFLALAYAKEKKLPVVIVRIFNTVGPSQVGRYGMVLPRFIDEALSNKPITVYGDGLQTRSFAYVKDVVRAMIDLSLSPKAEGEIFNIGNDKPISVRELAEKVKQRANSKSKIRFLSYKKAYGKTFSDFEEIGCRVPNLSKIKKFIGYKPEYGTDGIIDNTIVYYLENKRRRK
ncbi:MAG: GDP-mannose 4,6-dehydratase [Candidatus Ratteibacteria bacterium]|nr:GDP-mannose 4,6-dehydratase [Candidatus Ratteibacteria bacterium]